MATLSDRDEEFLSGETSSPTVSALTPAQQLIEWTQACNKLHGQRCQALPMSARSKEQIPHWVIDTEQACIVPGTSAPRYAALSYVWPAQGLNSDRLMLQRSNVSTLQQPGILRTRALIDRLPLVVRQTIELMREVQERFLWVDCLCIVQHDGDTQSQAYCMDKIYSCAYFTIIAAASVGLLGDNINVQHYRHNMSKPELHYDALMKSNWATRGWTFQEQILSKRAIIFLDAYSVSRWGRGGGLEIDGLLRKHIFWDCQCAVWDWKNLRPGPEGMSLEERFPEVGGDDIGQLQLGDTAWPKFRSYLESICLYSDRTLTYPQDILVAFSGVLNELGRSFPGGFVQGLPHCFIDETLIWQPFSKAVKRENVVQDGIAPYRYFSSWSWCSWKCSVDPDSLVTGLEYSADTNERLFPRSWRTIPLVEWSISADQSQELPLKEAAMQDKYQKLASRDSSWESDGWTKHCKSTDDGGSSQVFVHASNSSQRTRFPLPVRAGPTSSLEQMMSPYLSCTTRRAWFTVQDFFYCSNEMCPKASMKTSVFDLPQFKNGPNRNNACSVISLESPTGDWVGALRAMYDDKIGPGHEVELIAISRGEASYSDIVCAFEERVAFLHQIQYKMGHRRLFWSAVNRPGMKQSNDSWFSRATLDDRSRPQDLVDAFNRSQTSQSRSQESPVSSQLEGTYEFYNVMWIEWEGERAHRRAVGRIKKEAWERNCSEPAKIVLA